MEGCWDRWEAWRKAVEHRDRGSETAAKEDLQAQDAELKHRTGGKVAVCVCLFVFVCSRGHAVSIEVRGLNLGVRNMECKCICVRWSPVTSPQHYLRRFIPSLLFVPSLTCCLRMLSSSALRSRPGHAQIRASKHRRPKTWPLERPMNKCMHVSIFLFFTN